jgi:hypothetical protein
VQDLATETRDLLSHCGVAEAVFSATQGMTVRSPINGRPSRGSRGPARRKAEPSKEQGFDFPGQSKK